MKNIRIKPLQFISLQGRIGRQSCLREQIFLMLCSGLLLGLGFLAQFLRAPDWIGDSFIYATKAVFIWLYVSVGVRRLQDMDKSGWSLLKWYIPVGLIIYTAKETPSLAFAGAITNQQGIVLLLLQGAIGLAVMLHLVYTVFVKEGDSEDNRYGPPECGAAIRVAVPAAA